MYKTVILLFCVFLFSCQTSKLYDRDIAIYEDLNGGPLFPNYLILKDAAKEYVDYTPYNHCSDYGMYSISNDTLFLNERYHSFKDGSLNKTNDTIIDNYIFSSKRTFLIKRDKLIELTDYKGNCNLLNNEQLRCDFRKVKLKGHRFKNKTNQKYHYYKNW